MTALTLAIALTLTPIAAAVETTYASGCTSRTWQDPPASIRVKRIHHRGSSVPARIDVVDLDTYTGRVMASGAWPNRVWESAKVGAVAIRQYAVWMALNTCRSFRGQRYDITDSEQYYTARHVPARTARAVRIMAPITLTKNGHHFRTGWSGGQGDAWHLGEDEVRAMAERGAGWRTIVRRLLAPVRIVGDWR